MITVLVITLTTMVVLALATCCVMIDLALKIMRHMDYAAQRLESELIEIRKRISKP